MDTKRIFIKNRFLRFSINKYSFKSALFLISILIFFTACAGKQMSIEEAKQVTVSMSGKSFVPPPRAINDIIDILDQKGHSDLTSIEELRVKAEKNPPENVGKSSLANFYYNRGVAAFKLGRYNQSLADLRIAYQYSVYKNRRLIQHLSSSEYRCGNFKRAIELLESGRKLGHPGIYDHLVWVYSRIGDLESAKRYQQIGNSLCNELQTKWTNTNWLRVWPARMKANLLEAQGRYDEAEKYYRRILLILSPSSKRAYPIAAFWSKYSLSANLKKQGRLLEAESEARQTLKKAIGYGGKNSEIVAITIGEIGKILQGQGRLHDVPPAR